MDEERKALRRSTRSEELPAERYPLDELLAHSQELFGCRPEVIRGALALAGNSRTVFTVDELRQRVNEFLKKKVTF